MNRASLNHASKDPKESKQQRKIFTSDEDAALRTYVNKYGEKWDQIAQKMPNRSARQCQIRWKKYLAPHLRETMWTDEEDRLLLRTIETIGTKWAKIAKFFPGRSDVSLKNRYIQIRSNGLSKEDDQIPQPSLPSKPVLLSTIDITKYVTDTSLFANNEGREDIKKLFESLSLKQSETADTN